MVLILAGGGVLFVAAPVAAVAALSRRMGIWRSLQAQPPAVLVASRKVPELLPPQTSGAGR